MARTGRPRGDKVYDDYLPQTAAKSEMVERARELADKKYKGSIGALIRKALQNELDQERREASRGTGNEYDPDNFHD